MPHPVLRQETVDGPVGVAGVEHVVHHGPGVARATTQPLVSPHCHFAHPITALATVTKNESFSELYLADHRVWHDTLGG